MKYFREIYPNMKQNITQTFEKKCKNYIDLDTDLGKFDFFFNENQLIYHNDNNIVLIFFGIIFLMIL